MYQISTLQALLQGYTKTVVTVEEFCQNGEIGLGTFEDVNGEMIMLDGKVYRASDSGAVEEMKPNAGVPFAVNSYMDNAVAFEIEAGGSVDELKKQLNTVIDEDFGLNSMYVVRLDGFFPCVRARSEEGYRSHHIALSEILKKNQKDFMFENTQGSIVAVYFPDYMDGINAAGWHFHYISADRKIGGHVYDLSYEKLSCLRTKQQNIQIQLPRDMAFDTYALKEVSQEEVKKVEQ